MKQEMDSVGSKRQKASGEAMEADVIKEFSTSLTDLPDDIIISILLLPPIESIVMCKNVCKKWYTIISNPLFAQWHLQCEPMDVFVMTGCLGVFPRNLYQLYFEHKNTEAQNLVNNSDCDHICSCKDFLNSNCSNHTKHEVKFKLPRIDDEKLRDRIRGVRYNFDVINACNGFLCLCGPEDRNPLAIWNPNTEELTTLPKASKKKRMRDQYYCGFGYLKKTNKYKVVRICNHYVQHKGDAHVTYINTVVEIHSLGSGLWDKMKYQTNWGEIRFPTCFNGSLYWLIYEMAGVSSMLRLDLASETFIQYPTPPLSYMHDRRVKNIGFGELMGSLCICCPVESCIKIWTWETYGADHSWTESIKIDTASCDYWHLYTESDLFSFVIGHSIFAQQFFLWRPLTFLVGADILIRRSYNSYIYLDFQKSTCKCFEFHGRDYIKPIFFIQSLIKLKDAVKRAMLR